MKQFAIYIGLAASLAASCSTKEMDFQAQQPSGEVFYADFEQPAEYGTRVYVNEDLLLRWTGLHPKSNYITLRSCTAVIDCKEILEKMNVFTAQSNVGVIPCKNLDEAKTICAQVEKNVLAHVPKEA